MTQGDGEWLYGRRGAERWSAGRPASPLPLLFNLNTAWHYLAMATYCWICILEENSRRQRPPDEVWPSPHHSAPRRKKAKMESRSGGKPNIININQDNFLGMIDISGVHRQLTLHFTRLVIWWRLFSAALWNSCVRGSAFWKLEAYCTMADLHDDRLLFWCDVCDTRQQGEPRNIVKEANHNFHSGGMLLLHLRTGRIKCEMLPSCSTDKRR